MKNEHKHFLARLLVGAFLVLGLGFWMTNFVVKADSWTVGTITRNNANFLSGAFWDNNPTSGDIIKALYGSGGGQTAYTQNWSGYTFGSCLSGGMNVITTGILPTTLADHTIYVIASGTYTITTGITMNDCSALISSGIVTLSGNVGGSGTITATSKNNFIIEKIRTSNHPNGYGLQTNYATNFTINENKAYDGGYGIMINHSSYVQLRNIEIYNITNSNDGLEISNSSHISADTIITHDNDRVGIHMSSVSGSTLSGIISYNNGIHGVMMSISDYNILTNISSYNNAGEGIAFLNSNYNTGNIIDSHDNTEHNIYLSLSHMNRLSSIVADGSTTAMGIYLGNSTGNFLSGVKADGNYYAGVHFYNSSYNTGISITSDSNEGGLYLDNSDYNAFTTLYIANSSLNGISFFSGSDYNTMSGLVSSGNMGNGVYYRNSDTNTISNSLITYNGNAGILIETGHGNNILYSSITNNGQLGVNGVGITFSLCSGGIINGSTITDNNGHGIVLDYSDHIQILNSVITSNIYNGAQLANSNDNILSGLVLSGNHANSIDLFNSNNSTITNSNAYYGGFSSSVKSLYINDSTGTSIHQFSGNRNTYEYQPAGIFQYTTYDTYTRANNYIYFYSSYASATLTGNVVAQGSIFWPAFDEIKVEDTSSNYIDLSGATFFDVLGSNRDGILYSPTQITTGTKLCGTGETSTTNVAKCIDTIEIISGSTYITMNGGIATIEYYVLSGTSGQYLNILKSNNGTTWTSNTTTSDCTLDQTLLCSFTTTGSLKLFAFGIPTNYSFSGITQSLATVTSGGYYNTGVKIYFTGDNLSGAILNGSGYSSGTLITGDGIKTFILTDIGGNSTGMKFTIDTIAPTLAGVVSGIYYSGNITIIGSDTNFSGFQLSGIYSTGTSLTVTGEGVRVLTGYDKAGNTTGVTFTIDKTAPVFTGTTEIPGQFIVSGGYYNTNLTFAFYDLNISGATLSGIVWGNYGIVTNTGTYVLYIQDLAGNTTGITFTKDITLPSVTGTVPTSGQLITGSNTVVFTRTGSDIIGISGYYFSLTGTQRNTGNTTSLSRILTLLNGSYIRYVIASDRAGNTGITQMIPFTVHVPYSGTATLTGPNTMYIGTQRFTKSNANILLWANEPVLYTITGSIDPSITTGTLSSLMTVSPLLTGGDGPKDIFVSMVDGSGTTLTKTLLVTLDTVAPIPTLTTPISGASLAGAFTLNWSAGADAAGISGYQYLISPTPLFGTILASGFTTTPYVTIPNLTISMSGTLYRKIQAIDRLGNIGESVVQPFYYSGMVSDTTPDQFTFNTITNATVNHIYGSNTLTITGINTPVLANITRGVLYISGVMVGTTGYVQNGWTVKIEMNSSIDYDTLVTSTLNIGGVTSLFRITTETEAAANNNTDYTSISTDLSNTERLQIIAIFEALRDVYDGVKQDEFFSSFMVMLQSKIDDLGTSTSDNSKRDALQYLYDLADQYDGNGGTNTTDIAGTSRIINGIYTAPNGKKYRITYDSVKKQFTSTNFITPKYYPTLDVLKYDIDRNNRLGSQYADAKAIKARWGRVSIDGTRQTSPYTAPNHKVFYFFKNTDGQISSYTFTTQRYFDSLDATKEFIHNSNLR